VLLAANYVVDLVDTYIVQKVLFLDDFFAEATQALGFHY
jgi:hypothetical protein